MMQFDRNTFWFNKTSPRRSAMWVGVLAFALASGFLAGSMADDKLAGEKDKKTNSTEKSPSKKPAPTVAGKPADVESISPKREEAAVAFAQQHHRELAELLTRLKVSFPEEYMKALRELDKTRSRLEKAREYDEDRYAILLREWQLDSRVRLLAARLTMSTSAELEAELRQALAERHDARLQLLTYEREKSKTRILKMDEQIAEHVQNRESSIDREFDRIKKTAETRKKSLAKPAAKRTSDKDK